MSNKNFEGGAFVARHAQSKKHDPANTSLEHPSITNKGVEQAQEKARNELMAIIENSPKDSIVFLSGVSEQDRTRDTGEVFSEELAELYKGSEDTMVINQATIEEMALNGQEAIEDENNDGIPITPIIRALRRIKELIKENPDKRIIIDYPLQTREVSFNYKDKDADPESGARWFDKDGKVIAYWKAIMAKHNEDHGAAAADWVETDGKLILEDGTVLDGPNPQKVAEEHIQGIERLQSFAKRLSAGRPVTVGAVGHGFELTALAIYLANKGIVDKEGLSKIMGEEIIEESDIINIDMNGDEAVLKFHGKEFPVEIDKV